MDDRHIFIGMSYKVWCGERLGSRRDIRERIAAGRLPPPLTEGEYRDKIITEDICEACIDALISVRPT